MQQPSVPSTEVDFACTDFNSGSERRLRFSCWCLLFWLWFDLFKSPRFSPLVLFGDKLLRSPWWLLLFWLWLLALKKSRFATLGRVGRRFLGLPAVMLLRCWWLPPSSPVTFPESVLVLSFTGPWAPLAPRGLLASSTFCCLDGRDLRSK